MSDRELVKLAQARLDMTQKQLADAIGVGQRTVAGWATGEAAAPGPVKILLARIADGKLGKRDLCHAGANAKVL